MTYRSALMSGKSAALLVGFLSGVGRHLSPSFDSLIPSLIAFLSTRYEIQIVSISTISSTASSKSIARVIATSKLVMSSFLLRAMVAVTTALHAPSLAVDRRALLLVIRP